MRDDRAIPERSVAHPIIRVAGLRKSFGDLQAVRGVDFTVAQGELFAFLGPNGAGKSTTINMLCTVSTPDAGAIEVDGINAVDDPDAVRGRIGIVFQDSVLDRALTVRENLHVRGGFYYSNRHDLRRAVQRSTEATEIGDLLERPYGVLSGGQRRRVDIARSLLNTPRVLFMDEPTTGLDPQTRGHVWETITRLQHEHDMTIFLTTHYMEEASNSDYVVIVDEGVVAAHGSPAQMKERYAVDQLRILPKEDGQFDSALAGLGLPPGSVRRDGPLHILTVTSTDQALTFLNVLGAHIGRFEVTHGSMDDVFLSVTGKALRE